MEGVGEWRVSSLVVPHTSVSDGAFQYAGKSGYIAYPHFGWPSYCLICVWEGQPILLLPVDTQYLLGLTQPVVGTKSLTYANLVSCMWMHGQGLHLSSKDNTGDIPFTVWQRWVWTCHWWVCPPDLKAAELSPQIWTGQTGFFCQI